MKNKKIIKFLLLIIILCSLMYILQNTYSKYIEEENESSLANISRWNIKINNQSIANNVNLMGLIDLEDIPNDNIVEGFIAPTYESKFTINIDSTGTDVPYKYRIELSDGVPTNSTYVLKNTGTNGSGTYYFTFDFETFDYDYDLSSWNNRDNQPELKLYVGPDFNLTSSQINWWADTNYTHYDGEYLYTKPLFWAWAGDYDPVTHRNHFSTTFNLAFNKIIDLSSDKAIGTLFVDGKTFNDVKVPDFRITGYTLDGNEKIDIPSDQYYVEGIVEPKDEDETVNNDYTFYLEWFDGEGEIMDNAADVEASKPDETTLISSTAIPLKVTVTQATAQEVADYLAAHP